MLTCKLGCPRVAFLRPASPSPTRMHDVHTIQRTSVTTALGFQTRQGRLRRCRLSLRATRPAGPSAVVDSATFDAEVLTRSLVKHAP
jgi:hypothetical protein